MITASMLNATDILYRDRLTGWLLTDRTLEDLYKKYVDRNDEVSCLARAAAVSMLYGTRVDYLPKVAGHISQELRANSNEGLVERIAAGGHNKTLRSFAAKYCHFFVDREKYPIYDKAACAALKYFLERDCDKAQATSYRAFCENLRRLRDRIQVQPSTRELDRVLWVVGLWLARWSKINRELRQAFVEDHVCLKQILPPPLYNLREAKIVTMQEEESKNRGKVSSLSSDK